MKIIKPYMSFPITIDETNIKGSMLVEIWLTLEINELYFSNM